VVAPSGAAVSASTSETSIAHASTRATAERYVRRTIRGTLIRIGAPAADRGEDGQLVARGERGGVPQGGLVAVHPHPGGQEDGGELGAVAGAGVVEGGPHGAGVGRVDLVGRAPGRLPGGGEEPDPDGAQPGPPSAASRAASSASRAASSASRAAR